MEHTRLGRTGLKVSRICLGTMTFGLQIDEAASRAVLDRAAEGGVTFLDTADVYPLGGGVDLTGTTEDIIGRWLKGKRHQFVVASKAFGRTGPQPWDAGNNRRHIMDAIDASLRRLGTDYLDLYQLHADDPETPIDETLQALDDLVRAGKVRYIGCSNFLAYRLARSLGRSEALGLARFDSVQPRYNMLFREFERELFPLCLEEGVGVIPYNPLAGGMLSGKHDRAMPPHAGTRFTIANAGAMYQDRYWHDREFNAIDGFIQIAKKAGLKPATLAVAWVLSQPAVTAPIIGASRPDQLDDTLAAVDAKLGEDLLHELDELTREFRRGDANR
ncbi:MAG TPA: aldo/keto reductase [Candidatus Dormibacteraeota bacterium]|nr:aldo/keto reductase [Candidatus Dormibacteraeota bacterium]